MVGGLAALHATEFAAVDLFARRPDLPQKLINELAADEFGEQRGSVFDYLLVAAARATYGTEDYFIAGYRLLRPEEVEIAMGALEVQPKIVESAHDADCSSRPDGVPSDVLSGVDPVKPDTRRVATG